MKAEVKLLKRRCKGLLALFLCGVMVLTWLQLPKVVSAAGNNTVTVDADTTDALLGSGDSIGFAEGVYGNVMLADTSVFPTDGGETVIYVSGALYEKSFSTGTAYTVGSIDGLYRATKVSSLSDEEIQETGWMSPELEGTFVLINLIEVEGCKIEYLNATEESIAMTDYLVYGEDAVAAWGPEDGEYVKEGYELTGWGTVSGATEADYVSGAAIGEEAADYVSGGILSLYPVWEEVSEESSEEISEESSEEVSEESSEEISEESSEEVSEESSEEVSEESSEEVSEEPGEEVSEEPGEEVSEEPSEETQAQTSLSKTWGVVSIGISDCIYGGKVPEPQFSSITNDVSRAQILYKVTGADDSTYTTRVPMAVGDYTVKVILPENESYLQAVATDTFTISYLPAPNPTYILSGDKGSAGWYTSEVSISPPMGYELSVGDRNDFSADTHIISYSTNNVRLYLRKADTGEMTDAVVLSSIKIDNEKPEIIKPEIEDCYADEVVVTLKEENPFAVTVNGKTVESREENGFYLISIPTGIKREEVVVVVKDEAGNVSEENITVGPAWMKDGIVGEGTYYLEPGVQYSFSTQSDWCNDSDNMVYAGGVHFYVKEEGEATFSAN